MIVFQTDLENKLYQNFGKKTDYVSVGNHVIQKSDSLLLPVAAYYCGLPVPKGVEGSAPSSIGTIILLKGSASSIFSINGKTAEETLNVSNNYYAYSSVICAQKSIQKIKDERLLRYFVFLGKVLARNLEAEQKRSFPSAEVCSMYSRDVSTYALLRAYAVGSRLASVYIIKNESLMNDELLVTTINSATSQLEGLAVLSAVLTTWAGTDEKKFELYATSIANLTRKERLNGSIRSSFSEDSLPSSWLTTIDHPRFCLSKEDKKSCWCPRMSLTNAIAQRFRTAIMATLRNEVTRVQTGFNTSSPNVLPPILRDSRYSKHPDWPHMALNFLTASLCNQTWPMVIPFTEINATNSNVFQICPNTSTDTRCIQEDLINRLWRIGTHIDDKLGTSKAHHQYMKLASFPFLQLIMEKIINSRPYLNQTVAQSGDTDGNNLLHIFVGQFDSIKFLMRSLEVDYSNDLLYTAGRFVVELHRGVLAAVTGKEEEEEQMIHLRFLLDGEDITNRLPFCRKLTPVGELQLCPASAFVSYIQNNGTSNFWNFDLAVKPASNSSPFENYCRSSSVTDLLSVSI